MDGETPLEIVLPWPAPPETEATVYDRLGVVPDVKGPRRGIEVETIVLFMSAAFTVGLFEQLGGAAGERLLEVLQWLRRVGARPGSGDQEEPAAPGPPTATDVPREPDAVAGAGDWDTEIVIDHRVTVRVRSRPPADPRAFQAILTGGYDGPGRRRLLVWDPEHQAFVAPPPPPGAGRGLDEL